MMKELLPLTLPSFAWAPPSPPRGEGRNGFFLSPVGRGKGPSHSDGKVRGINPHRTVYSSGFNVAWMVSKTLSRFVNISAFQNLSTRKPADSRALVRFSSASTRSACCPPSNSMMSLASRLAKSATYPSRGTCRRNLRPDIWRFRSLDQRMASASVCNLRKARACAWVVSMRQSQLQSLFESRLKDLTPSPSRRFATGPFLSPPGRGKIFESEGKEEI